MGYNLGDTVPAFTLPSVDGDQITVDPAMALATVVVFTANHCPYALGWHDRIQQVARDYSDGSVQVAQINANDETTHPGDSTVASAARVANGEFAGPYLRDVPQDVARQFGAERTPDVFVYDNAGRLVYRGAPDDGYEDETQNADYIRAALSHILTGQDLAVPSTPPKGCSIKWRKTDLGLPVTVA